MLIHRYDSPDRFVTGTVGPPGDRTFFLQAREGARLTSVALEKQQVAVLAERLGELLARIEAPDTLNRIVVAVPDADVQDAAEVGDTAPLDQPIEEEFRVGTMTLAWDEEVHAVVVEAFAATESEDDETSEALVVTITATMAQEFASRARVVIGAGRATCPFCSHPIDPEGHLCPRANGFKRLNRG
ncbi:MAG: DUF3090 family protein [Nocardioidaceae bacterium]|nr:DUF3090 family protein [Nocardioidaceae bacterium]MDQ3164904.1 DUF3090 family protein [Actinomycetota bacterium]